MAIIRSNVNAQRKPLPMPPPGNGKDDPKKTDSKEVGGKGPADGDKDKCPPPDINHEEEFTRLSSGLNDKEKIATLGKEKLSTLHLSEGNRTLPDVATMELDSAKLHSSESLNSKSFSDGGDGKTATNHEENFTRLSLGLNDKENISNLGKEKLSTLHLSEGNRTLPVVATMELDSAKLHSSENLNSKSFSDGGDGKTATNHEENFTRLSLGLNDKENISNLGKEKLSTLHLSEGNRTLPVVATMELDSAKLHSSENLNSKSFSDGGDGKTATNHEENFTRLSLGLNDKENISNLGKEKLSTLHLSEGNRTLPVVATMELDSAKLRSSENRAGLPSANAWTSLTEDDALNPEQMLANHTAISQTLGTGGAVPSEFFGDGSAGFRPLSLHSALPSFAPDSTGIQPTGSPLSQKVDIGGAVPPDVFPAGLNPVSLQSTGPAAPPNPSDPAAPDVDRDHQLANTPLEAQEVSKYIQDQIRDKGSEILSFAVDKELGPNFDRSFQNGKLKVEDYKNLTKEQQIATYLDLVSGKELLLGLDKQYGDNLYAKNEITGEKAGRNSGNDISKLLGKDFDERITALQGLGVDKGMAEMINRNFGEWSKKNDTKNYATNLGKMSWLFAQGDAPFSKGRTDIGSALGSMNASALLASAALTSEDFSGISGSISDTYKATVSTVSLNGARSLAQNYDFSTPWDTFEPGTGVALGTAPSDPPNGTTEPGPLDVSEDDYQKWYGSLPEGHPSKTVQPLALDTFKGSEIATKLKEAGLKPGDETWAQYENAFIKDATLQYNNYFSNLRKGVKMDVVLPQTWDKEASFRAVPSSVIPSLNRISNKVPGIDASMFKAGVFHTVQNVTLAAAMAGTIINAKNGAGMNDPKAIMTTTYAASNLADMVLETASKYLDPKSGAFKKIGLDPAGKWGTTVESRLKAIGGVKAVEAAGKMVAGAGTGVFAAVAIWNTVNAIKSKDTPAAIFNAINALGSGISGVTLGMEGAVQISKGLAGSLGAKMFGTSFAQSFGRSAIASASVRAVLGTAGLFGGLIAGIGLTGLGLWDMAKGAKQLDKGLDSANNRYVKPLTGWNLEFVMGGGDGSFTM